MSNFIDAMVNNPPRLVVQFNRNHKGEEQFQWGIVADRTIPPLSLIGAVCKVQHDLCREEWMPETDETSQALVIIYDAHQKDFTYFCHRDIPVEPLNGMLEVIKSMLTASRMAQHIGANKVPILGPDGRQMRG